MWVLLYLFEWGSDVPLWLTPHISNVCHQTLDLGPLPYTYIKPTPNRGVSSWQAGWSLFWLPAGLHVWLAVKACPHTTQISQIKLGTSHLTHQTSDLALIAHQTFLTSVLSPPTAHLNDLRPATFGLPPLTSLLKLRTETPKSHLSLHNSELEL